MKKLLGVVLVFILVLGLAVGVFAAEPLKMGKADFAAHGTRSFAVAVVALQGDTIVGAYLDEYQFLSKDDVVAVPNGDNFDGFGNVYKDSNMVLASKRVNDEFYSNNMAKAGSTVTLENNFKAIEAYVTGKTISELQNILTTYTHEEMVDVISGATMVDNYGYVSAFLAAALNAQ